MAHATTRALSLLLFFLLPLRLPIAVHCQGLATAILARMEGDTEQPGRLGPKSQEDGDTSHRGDLHPILDARVVAGSVSATGATTAHITGAPRQAKPHGAAEQPKAGQASSFKSHQKSAASGRPHNAVQRPETNPGSAGGTCATAPCCRAARKTAAATKGQAHSPLDKECRWTSS